MSASISEREPVCRNDSAKRFARYSASSHGDVAVLHHLEAIFVLNFLDFEAGVVLFFTMTLDLVVRYVARPDDGDVAPRSVADPLLLTIEDPGVAIALLQSSTFRGGFLIKLAVQSGRSSQFSPGPSGGSHSDFCSSDPPG